MRKRLLTMLLAMIMLSVTACGKEPAVNDAGSLSQVGSGTLAETETDTEETLQEPKSDIESAGGPDEMPKPTEDPQNITEPTATPIATTKPSGTAVTATTTPAATPKPTAKPAVAEALVVVSEADTAAAGTTPEPIAPQTPAAPAEDPVPAQPEAAPAPTAAQDKPVDAPATPAPTQTPAGTAEASNSGHVHNIVYNWIQEEEISQCKSRTRIVDICSECGYVQRVLSDTGVYSSCTLGEQVWVTQPTCTTRGEYYQYCTKCGEERNHAFTVGEPSHSYGGGTVDGYSVEPTCVSGGRKIVRYTCRVCGDSYTEEEDVPPSELRCGTNGTTKAGQVSPATCTEAAVYDFACSVCGKVLGQGGDGTGPLGHEDNDGDGNCDRCGNGM